MSSEETVNPPPLQRRYRSPAASTDLFRGFRAEGPTPGGERGIRVLANRAGRADKNALAFADDKKR
jgi:hypothetical protein